VRNGVVDQLNVDGLTVLVLAGELDLSVVPALRRDLMGSAMASGADIVMDLRQVTFMDCSSIGALVMLNNHVRAAGGSLQLVGVPARQLRLLTLCRLVRVLPVHDSLQEASAALRDRHQHQAVPRNRHRHRARVRVRVPSPRPSKWGQGSAAVA
jgi:anti-sigma B factor antagonist